MRGGKLMVLGVALFAIVLTACSNDEDPTPSTTTGSASESMAPASDTGGQSITEIVSDNPDFSTLLAAVGEADLAGTLSGEGPFTVFAPTDKAFAALPDGTLETLLKPANRDQLAAILTYHVLPAEVMAADVSPGEVTTVNGATFTISVDGGDVVITDGGGNQAMVTQTDIVASNGVIHVIDSVLLPPAA
ncbi:MAG: fasciclin domain-containing protein [Actinomycetota bacterium]